MVFGTRCKKIEAEYPASLENDLGHMTYPKTRIMEERIKNCAGKAVELIDTYEAYATHLKQKALGCSLAHLTDLISRDDSIKDFLADIQRFIPENKNVAHLEAHPSASMSEQKAPVEASLPTSWVELAQRAYSENRYVAE